MAKWGFPSNQDSLINGLNTAGIETFKKGRIEALAKEICQNSMDAVLDDEKPVKVEFETFNLTRNTFPGYDDMLEVYNNQIEFWDEYQKNDKRVPEFYRRAKKILKKDKIFCLRVSDYNTTGLTGSNLEISGNWMNLVKASAVSDKPGTAGGSFGIGKFASFTASELYMVFFATKDSEKNDAFQGVTRLSSYRDNLGEMYQGVGFYGIRKGFKHEPRWRSLSKKFERSEFGTDIFIIAFVGEDRWEEKMSACLLDNFLFSFMNNRLEVNINGKLISKNNIHSVMAENLDNPNLNTNTKDYYDAITKNNKYFFNTKIFEKDDVHLTLRLDKNLGRRVAVVRKNGMKIFDKDRISNRASFSGVLYIIGDKVNRFFKSMENPAHDSWDEERHSNVVAARRKKQMIFTFIRESLKSLIEENRPDEVDAEGVGEFLPDFSILDKERQKIDSVSNNIINELVVKKTKTNQEGKRKGRKGKSKDTPLIGEIDDNGELYAVVPGDNKPFNEGKIMSGSKTEKGTENDQGNRKIKRRIEVFNPNYRIIKNGDSNRIIIRVNKSIDDAELELFASGETIKDKLDLVSASIGLHLCARNGNIIKIGAIEKNTPLIVSFKLHNQTISSMEAMLYENK